MRPATTSSGTPFSASQLAKVRRRSLGLKTARRGQQEPHWKLAANAYFNSDNPAGTRRRFGILEIERRLLVEAVYAVLKPGESLRAFKTAEWIRRWDDIAPWVAIPDNELPVAVAERRAEIWRRR